MHRSDPRRGVYPDLPGIRARGIPIGFATDWMMNDPFEGMRNALNALRLKTGKVEALTTAEALWFATMGSAQVMGLDREIGAVLAEPTIEARLADLGTVPMPLNAKEFGVFIATESEKWGKVVRIANIAPQ